MSNITSYCKQGYQCSKNYFIHFLTQGGMVIHKKIIETAFNLPSHKKFAQ